MDRRDGETQETVGREGQECESFSHRRVTDSMSKVAL